MKRRAIFLLLFFYSFTAKAQDSCTMQISLLTCAPGADLYSLFGHTAIRIRDSSRGMDIVYNYGTFDDSDPLFYVHFTRGIMLYSVSAEPLDTFMMEYEYEHRAVVAQVLNLTCAEKDKLYNALRKNTLEENRYYPYHFHTDNCTTRAAVIIESNTNGQLLYKNILANPGPSYRDMIHEYLDRQQQYWPEFGIDMFLGAHLDVKPSNIQAIHFLPDYLFRGMDSAYTDQKTLVAEKQTLLSFPVTKPSAVWFTPGAVFIFCLLLSIALFIIGNKPAAVYALFIFDIIFFSLLGLMGIVMAYLWLGRVDDVCRNNINILWAVPTNLIVVFFIRKKAAWIKYYFLITAFLAGLLLIGFPWWPQRMNVAVIPLLAIILFRSFQLFKNRDHAEKAVIQG